ncbi:MAG: NAD-dependent epimerase/dehydratase family protein, partial [Selenomonadaceae bacterium]|nr:NAD-dependent epimerase/dehydratase family protein [Selenomonadaceae bacterium]
RQGGVKRVLFSSTAAAYGDVPERDLPIKEAHKLAPMSFYGLSKVTAERYLELYHERFGLDYVVLRFANVYGERQGDGGEGGVISIFTKKLAENENITIFGDGEQTRDFIYAGDIARGIVAALETTNINTAYNLCGETETSLRELVSVLSKIKGENIIPNYAEERPGDIRRSVLSAQKAERGLSFRAKTPLKDGLMKTFKYFEQRVKEKNQ